MRWPITNMQGQSGDSSMTAQPEYVALPIGPMFTAGDPSSQPDGTTRSLRNYLFRPNRLEGRPPFVYDSLMSCTGFARWEDLTNQVTRTLAFDSAKLYKKTTANGWDAGTSATLGSRVTSYANMQGKAYVAFDNGSSVPSSVISYDGTNVSTTPFDTTLLCRALVPFGDRLVMVYPRITVTSLADQNLFNFTNVTYDFTASGWNLTNITASKATVNGTTVCRLMPTSATAASATPTATIGVPGYTGTVGPPAGLSASDTNRFYVWRCDLRNTHASYDMPITLEWRLVTSWESNKAYVVGDLLSDGTNLQRCTTAGTSGGVAPSWATTVGASTTDNTVTWRLEGSDVIASLIDTVQNVTDSPDWSTYYLSVTVPSCTNTAYVAPRIKLFSTVTPTITLATIEVSLRDGLTDGDPRKKNHGQQFTRGSYLPPFVNTESTSSSTVNIEDVILSEIDEPRRFIASSTFPILEVAGLATAAAVSGGRLFVFKRRGIWQFAQTSDPNIPIAPERPAIVSIGCLGPLAVDSFMDELFFIGEHDIYRMRVGEEPTGFCGDGMREEIMSKSSSTWVESQSTHNMPLLKVDPANREVWVYTQKNKLYVFNLESKAWSYLDVSGGAEVRALIFDTIGDRMLQSWGGAGVTRLDASSSAKDTIDNTATALSITNDIIFRPVEAFPERFQISCSGLYVYHNATASQTGSTLSLLYSIDRGSNWVTPTGYPVTISTADPLVPMPFAALGNSIMHRLTRTGFGGPATWSLSKVAAKIKVKGGQLPSVNATTA